MDKKSRVYLVAGKRTPFGQFGGQLSGITPVDLAVSCSKAALDDFKISPSKIDQVYFANVIPSSTDAVYGGRHVALKIGCDIETPGLCVNRLCGSGTEVINQSFHLIREGKISASLCVGSENMSMAPHLTYGGRFGTKYGPLKTEDFLFGALTDQYCGLPMGITAENLAEKYGITREECDQFALESHQKVIAAYKNGEMDDEIAPIIDGKKINCIKDEHFREDATLESLGKLRASFKKGGVVTPGTASGIVDGASCVIVASEKWCEENGVNPCAEIIDYEVIGVPPEIMGIGPAHAIKNLTERNKVKLENVDFVEINEAFASQTIACLKELGLDKSKCNIWGGAIALGHPLGASGVRISWTLARQLKKNKKKLGIASACIGGGQGIAILLQGIS